MNDLSYHNSNYHKENANKARLIANSLKESCQHCGKITNRANIKKHETHCYLNPSNKKSCPVCDSPIKNYKTSETCSYSCANKHFKIGPNNGNWKNESYRSTCFHYHKMECVVCGENNIVEVHHLDESKNNNNPENLIPLCPTHHQYWHSRFRDKVESIVTDYIKNWSLNHKN
jgi:hypothetical protein